ncbi:MAG TPA: hypothetical protein VEK07_00825 [Polyangiaceae bacterium]|nr:hypothetical protein [Polyangiaceae bacterium]
MALSVVRDASTINAHSLDPLESQVIIPPLLTPVPYTGPQTDEPSPPTAPPLFAPYPVLPSAVPPPSPPPVPELLALLPLPAGVVLEGLELQPTTAAMTQTAKMALATVAGFNHGDPTGTIPSDSQRTPRHLNSPRHSGPHAYDAVQNIVAGMCSQKVGAP